jgi:lipoprotein-anchoring transpeptidase ErfK/SrfK
MTGSKNPTRLALALAAILFPLLLSSCGSSGYFGRDTRNKMIVSVSDQKMLLVRDGKPVKSYKVSTSKFGVGDTPNSNRTPLGRMQVAKKVGCHAPPGAVFKSRRPTGEVLKPNSPGRDPIVTRILWLKGTEDRNKNAFRRTIYIHGTPEEKHLGRPASYGCIRMASQDVIDLYNRIGYGADVFVIRGSIQAKSSNQAAASIPRPGGKNRG